MQLQVAPSISPWQLFQPPSDHAAQLSGAPGKFFILGVREVVQLVAQADVKAQLFQGDVGVFDMAAFGRAGGVEGGDEVVEEVGFEVLDAVAEGKFLVARQLV